MHNEHVNKQTTYCLQSFYFILKCCDEGGILTESTFGKRVNKKHRRAVCLNPRPLGRALPCLSFLQLIISVLLLNQKPC